MAEQSRDDIIFSRVQYVVSERCSLRCKDCTHLMQYYQNPQDIELEKYKEAFEKFISNVNCISELRILGGEPFMNRNMFQVIEWFYDKMAIKEFTVYTNGTIIPNKETLNVLSRDKVRIRISDYGINRDKIDKLVKVLEQYKVTYYITGYDDWQDAGDIRFRNDSVSELKEKFSKCYERNCVTFFKGELHRCPRSAHAMNLLAMPRIKGDYIDLEHWDAGSAELKQAIRELQEKMFVEACNYCDGPNRDTQHIQPAIQTDRPINYSKVQ